MITSRWYVATCLSLVLMGAQRVPSRADDTTRTLQVILDSWKQRQLEVKSGRFAWLENQTLTKGSISGQFPPAVFNNAVVPPTDISLTASSTIVFDGLQMKYANDRKKWSTETNGIIDEHYTCTFDGSSCKRLTISPRGTKPWPQGSISPSATHGDSASFRLLPILLAFRGADKSLSSVALRGLRLTKQKSLVGGIECLVLQEQPGAPSTIGANLWVAPDLDNSIVRYETRVATGGTSLRIDISYVRDISKRPIPKSWQIMADPTGRSPQFYSASVSDFQLNQIVSKEEFDIEFPLGTVVNDTRTKPESRYVVRAADNRSILPEDDGATYEQILQTESGQANEPAPRSNRTFVVIVMVTGAVICGFWLIWRRR